VWPFNTYSELNLAQCISFWTVILSSIGFFMHVGMRVAMTAKILSGFSQYLQIAAGSAISAVPGAGIVVFVNTVLGPPVLKMPLSQSQYRFS